jgi:hypothetical protein
VRVSIQESDQVVVELVLLMMPLVPLIQRKEADMEAAVVVAAAV